MITCELCGAEANHFARGAGMGDERVGVCCKCNDCDPDDDCWPLSRTLAYSKGNLRCDDCGQRSNELNGRCPNGAGGIHTLVEVTP